MRSGLISIHCAVDWLPSMTQCFDCRQNVRGIAHQCDVSISVCVSIELVLFGAGVQTNKTKGQQLHNDDNFLHCAVILSLRIMVFSLCRVFYQ